MRSLPRIGRGQEFLSNYRTHHKTNFLQYRDTKLTLTQNYRRLGLAARLNAPTGGVEKPKGPNASAQQLPSDPLHINSSANAAAANLTVGEAHVERDPETGKILRVLRDEDEEIEIAGRKRRKNNPLGDPVDDIPDPEGDSKPRQNNPGSDIVRQLELQAAEEEEAVKKRRPRQQSKREQEWIEGLVNKYGDDYGAMFRDRKLNPFQQSEGDLRRRIRIWKERRAAGSQE